MSLWTIERAKSGYSPDVLQAVAMVSLVGCQHWTASALRTKMSISHSQPAVVSILYLTGSHEIDMLYRGYTEGRGLVEVFCSFFFMRWA